MALIFTLTSRPEERGGTVTSVSGVAAGEHHAQISALKFPPLEESARPHLWILRAFRQITDAIKQSALQDGLEHLRRAVAIVDVESIDNLDGLDPLTTTGDPHAAVVALLILTFPEVHWMFVGAHADASAEFTETHLLGRDATVEETLRLCEQRFTPLFDPAGLRERVRARIRDAVEEGTRVAAYVPSRAGVAVAVDEEEDYAFLNAYVAYRFGYRAHALTTYEGAARVLRSDVQRLFARGGEVFDRKGSVSTGDYLEALVTLYGETVRRLCPGSDVASFVRSAEFELVPSRSSDSRLEMEHWVLAKAEEYARSKGRQRAGLNDIGAVLLGQYGFAVTDDGLDTSDGAGIMLSLEDRYLNFPDKDPELNLHLSKPEVRNKVFGKLREVSHRVRVTTGHEKGSAALSLWCRLKERFWAWEAGEQHPPTVYKPWSGIFDIWEQVGVQDRAAWFAWPPGAGQDSGPTSGGHSAHGRLLLVAEQLIGRAHRILETAHTVPDAIQGAVLALDAKEYLGHRTPTTSLQALALQHRFEVIAECRFYGVEYNMNVTTRFADVERELASVSEWFLPAKRDRARLNAELRIVSELLLIFREHSQFDEEQRALVKLRSLHRGLWLRRNYCWAWVLWPLRAYIEMLLRSLGWLVGAFVFWIVVLSSLYVLSGHGADAYWADRYWHGFVDTMVSFVGLSPPHDFEQMWRSPGALRVCMGAFALGFLHLGIFITHLYAILTRR
jgi:hypothetical protein